VKVAHENIKKVNEIVSGTVETIGNSRKELLDIVGYARKEYQDIKKELEEVKEKIREVVKEVDFLEVEERKSRHNLSRGSKDFKLHTENDIREAYEMANDLRTRLVLKREERNILIEKGENLEVRLKESFAVLKKAENITKQVSVATGYLKGNLDNILVSADDLCKKQYLGIKIIEAQEEEKYRLARDIHDGPAQSLASIVIKAELLEKLMENEPLKAKEELKSLKIVVKDTLKEVRKVICDLRPMSLDYLGLKATIERHVYNFKEDTGIDVKLKVIGKIDNLDSAIEIAVFRIIQEALSNVYKHSKASKVHLVIENTTEKISVTISDNGMGFDTTKRMETEGITTGGYGIASMEERVGLLGGEITIRSFPGSGTRISLYIPLNEGEI